MNTNSSSHLQGDALNKARWELLLISILALFCELMVIRWLAAEVRIFAYFKNLPLMAAFLGLGLGFIWTQSKRDYFNLAAISLLYLSGLLAMALPLGLTFLVFVDPLKYMFFGFSVDATTANSLANTIKTLAIMMLIFALTASVFVGLGQRTGRLFAAMKPLEAYSINILGALVGTIVFSLLSFAYTTPGIWLMVAGVLFLLISRKPAHFCLIALGIFYCVWFAQHNGRVAFGPDYRQTIWSPYYRIDVRGYRPEEGPAKGQLIAYEILANYDSLQAEYDATPQSLSRFPPEIQKALLQYHAQAFAVLRHPNSRVLILGSGAGADVAAALRSGAGHVDAVEIDPAIAQLGKDLHPERPYLSPKVDLYVTDARAFLRNCRERYDLILFAYLDSHAAFSCLSSLRMDNYVFTQESINDAAKLLKPDGVIAIGCVLMSDWLWQRHAKALYAATKIEPLGFGSSTTSKTDTGMLISGPGIKEINISDLSLGPPKPYDLSADTPVAEDDWPFLFLPQREIPTLYVLPILAMLLLSFMPVATQFARGARASVNWQMFFLGSAFMLLEVRAMADLSLLFGSTWLVNSVVIAGVMLVILAGTGLAARLSLKSIPLLALGLFLALLLTMLVKTNALVGFGPTLGGLMGTMVYLIPMGLAATTFGLLFKNAADTTEAMAFNLIGGIVGVCLEYISMWLGIQALGWIVIALYACAFCLFAGFQKDFQAALPSP